MRVAFASPMTTAGATDRGTANGIEKKGKGCDCHCKGDCCWEGGRGTGAAPTICSSHHHHRRRPDGNLIAAVGVTGLCVIEMNRRATPLERNYYYHLCVYEYEYEYVVCSCHNHQKPQSHRSRSGAKPRPAGAISHQPSGIAIVFPLCAAWRGLVWFGFVFCLLFFIPLLMLYATLCAGCTHFHMNAPQTWHTHRKGVASARCPGEEG